MLRRITQVTIGHIWPTHLVIRLQSTDASKPVKEKWDLYAGVLVERLPIVSKTFTPLEKEFQELLWRVEYEKSLKSNHELQHERDLLQAELIKSGKAEVDLDDTKSSQTAQDLKDAYIEELMKFKPAPRNTTSNDVTSTYRHLEDILYLLVEQRIGGKEKHLLLPQGQRQDGETMRQAAERVLRERCGEQLQVQFYGNAPVGFYKYKYPSSLQAISIGAKIFFYRAALKNGNVDRKQVPKFEWLTKEALDKKLKNAAYVKSIKKFLLE